MLHHENDFCLINFWSFEGLLIVVGKVRTNNFKRTEIFALEWNFIVLKGICLIDIRKATAI